MITRRRFLVSMGALAGAPILARTIARGDGRLTSRPRKPTRSIAVGDYELPLSRRRPTLLYVPPGYTADRPAPLLICLHGATGAGINQLNRYRSYAEQAGAVVIAPNSDGATWDAIRGTFDDDCAHLDGALDYVFDRCAIDPRRVAIGGFSDGATYAVSLGVINGTLFTHVLAFSPGFIIPGDRQGRPLVFISHGVRDEVLPIDRCGRAIARRLKGAGYAVTLREFEGGHQMPESMIPMATAFAGWKGA
jgi:phospholipase/carboxylesterase